MNRDRTNLNGYLSYPARTIASPESSVMRAPRADLPEVILANSLRVISWAYRNPQGWPVNRGARKRLLFNGILPWGSAARRGSCEGFLSIRSYGFV